MSNCKNCGAPIIHNRYDCPYCGTIYAIDSKESYHSPWAKGIKKIVWHGDEHQELMENEHSIIVNHDDGYCIINTGIQYESMRDT